jgi:hypothetical protein
MIIDCDTCTVRGLACQDCVITVLLSNPLPNRASVNGEDANPFDDSWYALPVDLDADEQSAVQALASAGLVPPLRLVPKYHVTNSDLTASSDDVPRKPGHQHIA